VRAWKRTVLAAFGLLAMGAGCATSETANDRVSPEVPLWYRRPSNTMSVLVQRSLTASGRTTGEDWERGRAEIDAAHGRVFLGTADRGFYALRAGDGSTIWRFETLGVVQCESLYDSELDVVYFGSHDGALYAVRAFDGSLLWRYFTGAEVARRPVRNGEMLYFANGADQLFAVDRRTGKKKWQAQRTSALGMEIAGYAGPTLANGKVYLAYSDGHVAAYDARDGSEKWTPVDLSAEAEQTSASGEAPRYLDVDTTPVPNEIPGSGNVIYVASYAGGVFALDAETGARVWANDQARGVTDLTLFREAAHAPDPKGPDRDGPTVPERKLLLGPLGSRSDQRKNGVAQRRARGRRHRAGAGRGRAARGHHALWPLSSVAAQRPRDRRLRHGYGRGANAVGLRQPRLRHDQCRHLARHPDRTAGPRRRGTVESVQLSLTRLTPSSNAGRLGAELQGVAVDEAGQPVEFVRLAEGTIEHGPLLDRAVDERKTLFHHR